MKPIARVAFVVYACVLSTLTHWPKLRVESSVPRTDLFAHLGAYAIFGFLLGMAAWFGAVHRVPGFVRTLLAALAYAAIDEGSQALPFLGRFAGVDDYLANAAGIVIGLSLAVVASRSPRLGPPPFAGVKA
ncbi:MAG: VanZ family protein [Planctomycetota bacterium]